MKHIMKKILLLAISVIASNCYFTTSASPLKETTIKLAEKTTVHLKKLEELFVKTDVVNGKSELKINDHIVYKDRTFVIQTISPIETDGDQIRFAQITLVPAEPFLHEKLLGLRLHIEAKNSGSSWVILDQKNGSLVRCDSLTLANMPLYFYKKTTIVLGTLVGALIYYSLWS